MTHACKPTGETLCDVGPPVPRGDWAVFIENWADRQVLEVDCPLCLAALNLELKQ